eukprot:TRINITY_DN2724_c0_g2_i1.p1 TRINITY_DN2724_c0_g2~~TRINITY_DN2724_c0_g2_i1.p1  ORF type:complete len:369 (+),score=112.88 TRINITY_DN2724_c0_g2_i1:37-1143(+)
MVAPMRVCVWAAVVSVAAAAYDGKPRERTLVSYVYYKPAEPVRVNVTQPYEPCGFEGGLCGCAEGYGFRGDGVDRTATAPLTPCNTSKCYCEKHGGRVAVYRQCTSNLEFFVAHGVTQYLHRQDMDVDFLFNVPGETEVPESLGLLASAHPERVKIAHPKASNTDLCTQGDVVRHNKGNYTRFALINCSGRGPYKENWLEAFEGRRRSGKDVHLVGPVINCWVNQPHVQSWAWYADETAAEFIAAQCECGQRRNLAISKCEIAVSTELLKAGENIASMQPAYTGLDFKKKENLRCGRGKSPVSCQRHDPHDSPACRGSDPCEEIFVKYGGSNIQLGFIPAKLHENVRAVEKHLDKSHAHMCQTGPHLE